ncbi:katanin p80 WD40 repeat-containing subunit B1 homolog [Zea mays]|uniref:Katanin p80 WD40 repeat-containing subunit B1 homolog n=1 Tax=Zea mays TaxID=4577 RepID=A0A1D6DT78_MAIZE|nr:katanin p80 WD40 repeat-containing subunit B1 homolog [Zea mays]ONM12093.1 Katanin p80 WD40 repeat-containing subunit B1-like protein [Zea mays]ONM12106.1 Katanin p80 WD40 repeat-containing subunit B1-like protein [Zea mays]ONM12109.1 Katanin p80 WD40 repeat-containing subunit B1-like protein [Zea mays]|eukprot:XP_008668688.1 katanin p80 WD40 repeat-containing subunit B1 homolog [Zea mays]
MTTNTKRAYKLQEFVAHSSNVNCLKIGRKTSRVLVTGGEDHKVNLWAIGKPNSILSLSGHTSAVESVGFDSTEVFVAAGAASGTIKLWDLEEAKIVRTLTGHRSNCMSVDFHPFGEFFASGSLDTNLKIWDIRRKNCIHTYKGHTRGVNTIRFTPDGRWVVSGGEDNIVKLWDLTAGKLLHEFKCHEGQIQCIDFHPHEFLLATGSADKTVKFWDLETFELIGSTGPETTGVRSMTFNPDGRSLLCGLHESLKVFSWEPIRCHDTVDVGWSRLADLNVHEGKLLGCSFNQSCVGIWVVDLTRLEPYTMGTSTKVNGHSELKTVSSGTLPLQNDSGSRANIGRSSVLQNTENNLKTTSGRLSASQNSDSAPKETNSAPSSGLIPSTPHRAGVGSHNRSVGNSAFQSGGTTLKRSSLRNNSASNVHNFSKADVVPVIVPRTSSGGELATDSRSDAADVAPVLPKVTRRVEPATDSRKESNDVELVVPRASSRMEIADLAPISSSKSGRRLESAPDSKEESADTAPVVVSNPRANVRMEIVSDSAPALSKSNRKLDSGTNSKKESADAVIVPRTNSRMEMISDSRREPSAGRISPFRIQSRYAEPRKLAHARTDSNKVDSRSKITETEDFNCQIFLPRRNSVFQTISSEEPREDVKCGPVDRVGFSNSSEPNASVRNENYVPRMRKPGDNCYIEVSRAGRARSSVSNWEGRDQPPSHEEPTTSSSTLAPTGHPYSSRGSNQASEAPIIASDEDVLSLIMERHDLFLSSTKSRLMKLQIIHQMWERNDIRGVLSAMDRMGDHAVCADMASVLMEKSETITLDLCTSILPVVTDLLESKIDRHLVVALELLVKLVRTFGPMIHSTVSSGPCVGVDLEAEQRRERCNLCFIELEKAKNKLPSLTRRKGAVANAAQELALVFQEIMS